MQKTNFRIWVLVLLALAWVVLVFFNANNAVTPDLNPDPQSGSEIEIIDGDLDRPD